MRRCDIERISSRFWNDGVKSIQYERKKNKTNLFGIAILPGNERYQSAEDVDAHLAHTRSLARIGGWFIENWKNEQRKQMLIRVFRTSFGDGGGGMSANVFALLFSKQNQILFTFRICTLSVKVLPRV